MCVLVFLEQYPEEGVGMLWWQLAREDQMSGDLLSYAREIFSLYIKKDRTWRDKNNVRAL